MLERARTQPDQYLWPVAGSVVVFISLCMNEARPLPFRGSSQRHNLAKVSKSGRPLVVLCPFHLIDSFAVLQVRLASVPLGDPWPLKRSSHSHSSKTSFAGMGPIMAKTICPLSRER